MNNSFLFLILVVFCSLSCETNTQTTTASVKKNDKNTIVNHKPFSTVNTVSLKKIKPWKEYQLFDNFIKRFEKISPEEAFDNIFELKELTVALEDSLNIEIFKTNSFKSRLHVLENEVLRLDDMATIPAITTKEVNAQIDKLFLVYGSLNDKINTAFSQEKYEKEINLDNFFTMEKKELMEKSTTAK